MSVRRSILRSSNGATIKGQLMVSAPNGSNLVLKYTKTSAVKTFTCSNDGTAKLFNARTNVSTADEARAPRADGSNNQRIREPPVSRGSLSNCARSRRDHDATVNSVVTGQSIRVRRNTAPVNE